MALTAKKLLAIDWDKRDLRMAMVRLRGDRVELLKAVSVPLPGDLALDNAELLGAFIREAMRQSGLGAKHAMMAVPRDQVVLNTLQIPPTLADDMPALVQFQVVKELPFAADQAAIDFAVPTGHDPKASCSTLVAAMRMEALEFYRQVAREAGLTLERVGLRPYSNLRSVLASHPELSDRTVLVVEVGPYLTEIDIIQNGSLAFSRAALVPLPALDGAARVRMSDSRIAMIPPADAADDETTREAVGRLMVELIRSYEAHRATAPQTSVDQIVVCGSTGLEAELAQSLAARFAAKAELFMPDRALDLTPQRAKELRGFSAVLGLAIGHGRAPLETFDFLKPKKPISKRVRRLRKAPIAIGAAILVVGFAIWAQIQFVRPAWAAAEKKRQDVVRLQKFEKPCKEFIKQVQALEDWQASEQYWPEVLADITRVFPQDQQACVDRVDLDVYSEGKSNIRNGKLSLKLRVAQSGGVNAVGLALSSLGYPTVTLGSEIPRTNLGGTEVYRFDTSLTATLPMREPHNWEDEAGDGEGREESSSQGDVEESDHDAGPDNADDDRIENDSPGRDSAASGAAAQSPEHGSSGGEMPGSKNDRPVDDLKGGAKR